VKSVDVFLDRMPSKEYNCFDFVREVWLYWFDEDVTDKLTGLQGAFADRKANVSGAKAFRRLSIPENPCFIILQRRFSVPHVGIYLDREMLHLKASGVTMEPLNIAKSYFTSIRFYR
jgi:hypothetical protein